MAETVKGVMREVHVKTKDDFGNADWDSVYKIGTETTYIKMPGSGKNLSDILGYDSLDETGLLSIFGEGDNKKTIKDLVELKDSILDFDANYTSIKQPITNSKSLWVADSKDSSKSDGLEVERFQALMPALTAYNQAFYSGDFTYYALGGIYGPGAWLSIRNFDDESSDNLQHEEDFRQIKRNGEGKETIEDLRTENCIEKKIHDIISKNGFSIKSDKTVFNEGTGEEENERYSLRIYRGCRIEKVSDRKLGLENSIKIMDTGPAGNYFSDSTFIMMPVMFVVPPHTMVYTRNTDRTSARYAINFYPCSNLEQKAIVALNEIMTRKGEAFTVEKNSFSSRINGEEMRDPIERNGRS